MWPLSERTFTFVRSRDFQLLIIVLHVSALIVLWLSHWPIPLVLCLTVVLFVFAVVIVQEGVPHTEFTQWVWKDSYWLIHYRDGSVGCYTRVCICYDVGLFMRIELSNKTQSKKFIIFADQLTEADRRALYLTRFSQT